MNTKSVRLLALAASVAFAACGETTDLVLGELSQAEAEDLAGAVVMATFQSTSQPPSQPAPVDGPQMAPYSYESSFSTDVACPLGGMVGVSAEFAAQGDDETGAGSVSYTMTQVHDGCMVTSEAGREFTLTGSPSLTLSLLVEHDGQGVVEWGGSANGAIRWETDGRHNTCEIAIEFGGRQVNDSAVSGEMAGTICNVQFTRAFSIG